MQAQPNQHADDERFMSEALAEAHAAAELGEVPIGAVVVCGGKVITRAHNRRELDEDPSAHAEFSAVLEAARVLGRWRLSDCTVYVTLEPCPMCAGLMVNARIGRCVYGAADPKAGALGSLYHLNADGRLNHAFPVTAGVCADACGAVLREFFAARRAVQLTPEQTAGDRAHAASRTGAPQLEPAGDPMPSVPERGLRVALAIDSFKGCATSARVEEWVAAGVRRAAPSASVICLPIADGGEGTVEAVKNAMGGRIVECSVSAPLNGATMQATYLLSGEIAVIEMAAAAGLHLSSRTQPDALAASTYGVGELVLDAIRSGARTIYVGLGGSCSNDGGSGFLQALGARLLDSAAQPIPPGLAGLSALASADLGSACDALAGIELVGLTDVSNPLVGRKGALAVFGLQKGLSPEDAAIRDRDMIAYGRLLDEGRAHSVLGVPGAGAAGGLGAAVLAAGGRLTSGIETVLDLIGFDAAASAADLVITGEGHIDAQSAQGKAPVGVARRAKRAHKPVVAVVGGRAEGLDAVYRAGIDLVIPIAREPMLLEQALSAEEAQRNLICAGETAARAYLMGRP